MYVLTSSLGLCQQRTDFGHLGGIVRVDARNFGHFLVGSCHVGIGRFTYQTRGLIGLTPFWVWLLFVRSKISTNWGVRLTMPDALINQPTNRNVPKHALRSSIYVAIRSDGQRSGLRRAENGCST